MTQYISIFFLQFSTALPYWDAVYPSNKPEQADLHKPVPGPPREFSIPLLQSIDLVIYSTS